MPGSGHSRLCRSRPGVLLNVALVAWLSVAAMPCTIFVNDADELSVQVDCHGVHDGAPATDPEWCCDPLAVTGGEGPKPQRADLIAALVSVPLLLPTVEPDGSTEWVRPTAHSDTGPPVYLATRRLRI